MVEIKKIETRLEYDNSKVKAWRIGDFATAVLVPGVNVNVDGSPRAYSVGNKGLADIQNGVSIFDEGEYIDFATYRERHGKSFTSHWLDAERNNFAAGTRQFNAFALYSSDTSNIVGNGKGQPKTQQVSGESIDYYISITSSNSQQANYPKSDQRRYFDSGEIPAFVVPGHRAGEPIDPLTALLAERQLAWAYYPDKKHSIFAIGGDQGPRKKFGEATIAFHLLLRYGQVLPIPHYKADANYTKCSATAPPSTWVNCLYYPFYQRVDTETHQPTDKLRVDNLKDTLFVFFNKDVKVEDPTVTRELIQSKGNEAMGNIGGLNKLIEYLRQIPELTEVLENMSEQHTQTNNAEGNSSTGQNSSVFLQLAETVNQSVPAKRLVEYKLANNPNGNPRYWAIVDFNQPSTKKRFYLFDTKEKKIVQYYVAHGKGSEGVTDDAMADVFSNVSGSNCSSLGVYRCDKTYEGAHGLSLLLDGLEATNSNVRARSIVLHNADYVSDAYIAEHGRIGRSKGCFVVEKSVSDTLVNELKNGSFIIAWKQ